MHNKEKINKIDLCKINIKIDNKIYVIFIINVKILFIKLPQVLCIYYVLFLLLLLLLINKLLF